MSSLLGNFLPPTIALPYWTSHYGTLQQQLPNQKDPTEPWLAKMCHLVTWQYVQCGHRKRTSDIYPCPEGHDDHYQCNADELRRQVKMVEAPKRCPTCFRATEDRLRTDHAKFAAELEKAIRWDQNAILRENIRHAAELARGLNMAELAAEVTLHLDVIQRKEKNLNTRQERLKGVPARQQRALAAFRASQGVWGDG